MNLPLPGIVRTVLIVLGWTASTAALTLAMMFLGYLLPKNINGGGGLYSSVINASPLPLYLYYIGNFALCIIVTVVISDMSTSLISFFISFLGAAAITVNVLSLPDYLGCCGGVLEGSAVGFTFAAFFPLLFLIDLVATLLGITLAEHFL